MKLYYLLLYLILLINGCSAPDEETGYVNGKVKSISGNSPIAGVLVQCNGSTYTTSVDGYYKIENIPIGSNQLIASKTDFEVYSKTINVISTGTLENISLVSNILGASVWGYVKKTDGTPIIGASVTIANMKDQTDATGRYQLPSIPQGNQNILVEASGYETYNQSFYMYSSDKQININLRKYFNEEFELDKDTYVSNLGTTTSGGEGTLLTTNCLHYAKFLYL